MAFASKKGVIYVICESCILHLYSEEQPDIAEHSDSRPRAVGLILNARKSLAKRDKEAKVSAMEISKL